MKNLIFFLFLFGVAVLQAQDYEPSPWLFRWGYSNNLRQFEPDSFRQTSVQTGFQWFGSLKTNNALKNNARGAGNYLRETGTVNTPILLTHQPTWIDATGYVPGYFGAVFMQYEPTLPLTSANIGTILRTADSTNSVFGFQYIGTNKTKDDDNSRES